MVKNLDRYIIKAQTEFKNFINRVLEPLETQYEQLICFRYLLDDAKIKLKELRGK